MKIGIIAYNAACNFGANLQLLSTVEYIRRSGNRPIVINWLPITLENLYKGKISAEQRYEHLLFRNKYYNESSLCRNAQDVAKVIMDNDIDACIIGSDAVAQHHPFISRVHFPSRHIISLINYSEDCIFPNVFWGTFNQYLKRPIPVAILSASCQNSPFYLFSRKTVKAMYRATLGFSYISARDTWTQKMYSHISKRRLSVSVTPDPVFGFNFNVDSIPSKADIIKKFNLHEKYYVFGLFNNHIVSSKWLEEFQKMAHSVNIQCVALAFPEGVRFVHPFEKVVNIPLSPLDWYALIKYSQGYIGHNMHPIVVALHNSVPFYSFDNYGITAFGICVNQKSSKIYHILESSGFLDNRMCDVGLLGRCPNVKEVFSKLQNFDIEKCRKFSAQYYLLYSVMMEDILRAFEDNAK